MRIRSVYIVAFSLLVHFLSGSTASAGSGLRHIRVIWHENPAHEATISWTHDREDPSSTVYFDEVKHGSDAAAYTYRQKPSYVDKYSKGQSVSYHVRLNNLKPSTNYHFLVESAGDKSAVFSFATAPTSEQESYSLLLGGDSRSNPEDRQKMNARMKSLLQQNPGILALVHGGDYVQNGASWEQWEEWLDDNQSLMTDDGRLLPIIPARGNHEIDPKLFNEVFNSPGNGDVYYVTKMANLSIVTLNTEISTNGEQKDWLDRTLKTLSSSSVWITANYHRPAYPAVKLASDPLIHWVPLFEKYLVDLVFESDGHTLKRTVPIRNNRRDDQYGITYVGEGGLGVKQREPKNADSWYLQSPGYATAAHHVQQLTVAPGELHYEVILMDGSQYDSLTLKPRTERQNAKALHIGKPLRLYNQSLDHCLSFRDSYSEDVAVHGPCSTADSSDRDDIFTVSRDGSSDNFRLKHSATGKCLTFTGNWLFMDRHKVMLLPCQAGNSQQILNIREASFIDWQVSSKDGQRCLHMGSLFRNSDDMPQSYHIGCGRSEQKELFQFLPESDEN